MANDNFDGGHHTMKIFKFAAILLLLSQSAFAYNSIINTGSITETGTYKIGSELQVLTDDPSGANVLVFVDLPTTSQSLDYRLKFGTGTTDVNFGFGAKWIPIPDLQNQPAIGAYFDIDWISDNSFDFISARVAPMLSKSFSWEYGVMTPYAAVPLGLRYYLEDFEDDLDVFVQLTFGAELNFEAYDKVTFFGEAGFDIDQAITYFSLALRYQM